MRTSALPNSHANVYAGRVILARAVLATLAVLFLAACGSDSEPQQTSPEEQTQFESPENDSDAETQKPEGDRGTEVASNCTVPSGQVLAALRSSLEGRDLFDGEWVEVQRGKTYFVAAEVDSGGPRTVVVVSYADNADYLAGMRAVNGTARSLTDLPASQSDRLPTGAEQALECLDG